MAAFFEVVREAGLVVERRWERRVGAAMPGCEFEEGKEPVEVMDQTGRRTTEEEVVRGWKAERPGEGIEERRRWVVVAVLKRRGAR